MEVIPGGTHFPHMRIRIDEEIDYKDSRDSWVSLFYHSPFSNYLVGDYIEIDLDEICHCYRSLGVVKNESRTIRRASSVVVSSSSSQQLTMDQFQAMGNQMMDRAERSNGQMEARWIARQEYNTDGSIKAREFGWVYKKSN